MIMKILNVKRGAYDENTDKIYNFWIEGQLKSGLSISVFDTDRFDLREYIDHKIDCLIFALDAEDLNDSQVIELKGNYLLEYKIPSKWLTIDKNLGRSYDTALKTKDGVLLIESDSHRYYKISDGDLFTYRVLRFDLIAWLPHE